MSSPIEEIKSRIDIVELVGSYVRLTKAGVNFKANCPFHSERTPSFVVSPARQIWHCFGCAKGGDIFRFVMEADGYDFPEALKVLADRAGVVVQKEDPKVRNERTRQLSILEDAVCFFELALKKNKSVQTYLQNDRGLAAETIQEWRVGYSPIDWTALTDYLRAKGFSELELERAGLAIKAQNTATARYYDRFRGRIIFPVFDYQGRVIAFGGRIFPERQNEAKYINSPETTLYQKSKVLYGLHRAKTDILKSGVSVVVEGYMDTLMAHQAGTHNVVASSGTALTPDHLRILRRLSEKLVAAFDMDLAGEAAAARGISLALKEGFAVTVVDSKDIKDPADLVKKDPALWHEAIKNARHIVQFYIDTIAKHHDIRTPEGARAIERTVLPVIASLASALEQAHWVKRLHELLGIEESVIWSTLRTLQHGGAQTIDTIKEEKTLPRTRKQLLEERILAMVIKIPSILAKADVPLEHLFFSHERAKVFSAITKELPWEDTWKHLANRLAIELELFLEGGGNPEVEFATWCRDLKREYLKERMAELAGRLHVAEHGGNEDATALSEEFAMISHSLHNMG